MLEAQGRPHNAFSLGFIVFDRGRCTLGPERGHEPKAGSELPVSALRGKEKQNKTFFSILIRRKDTWERKDPDPEEGDVRAERFTG